MWDAPTIAAVVSIFGLAGGLVLHVIKYAYDKGVTDNRLSNVETAVRDMGQVNALVSGLSATVTGLKDSVDGLHEAVNEMRRQVFNNRRDAKP